MYEADVSRRLRPLLEEFQDTLTGTVYHYTTAEGLRGIVTSGEVWLTNAAFVNDLTECMAFWQSATDWFGHKKLSNESVQSLLDIGQRPQNDRYYIASFSRGFNSLPQYRAYGSFCIGFDPSKMRGGAFRVYECLYKERDIKKWIREKSEKSEVPEWGWCCPDEAARSAAASDLLFAATMKYKSKHYDSEREVRLAAVSNHKWTHPNWSDIYENDPPIHFRDHPTWKVPVPYVKFFVPRPREGDPQKPKETETATQMKNRKLMEECQTVRDLLPITELWIGPMARQEEARLACEILLREKGYEDVQVQVSTVPYRGV